jgi:hypothetical protein
MEEEKKRLEEKSKTEYTQEERLLALKAALELPKLLKSGALTSTELKLFSFHRLKFKGPDPPALQPLPPPVQEG